MSGGTSERSKPLEGDAAGGGRQGPSPLERLASFRFTYVAIFIFLVAYAFTVDGFAFLLQRHFQSAIAAAAEVNPSDGPVVRQVQDRVAALLGHSPWIRWGGVQVQPIVLGADGRTLLYAPGRKLPPETTPGDHPNLLPALVDVSVAVPHNGLLANGVLVLYASILIGTLMGHTRQLTRREQMEIASMTAARDAIADRASTIQGELDSVRARLAEVEPEKEIYAEEIDALEEERTRLLARLAEVESREESLRMQSSAARDLADERRALEELLEEAGRDLATKDAEIGELRSQVKRSVRREAKASREADVLGRRLRTLYKNLEMDDRAVQNLVDLGDESLRLRAEEAIKRLSDEPENAVVRRKVGGLPPHLSIFEMAFAGKGRIYYTKGRTRRVRLLAVGAKNTQKVDLEYLSRLPKET
jgi:predicted  nucleic acid-binding Zn-ribbon protein